MKIIRAYKTELKPTRRQAETLLRFCNASRVLHNWALGRRKEAYEAGDKLTRYDQQKEYTLIRKELIAWADDLPRKSMDFALIEVEEAYDHFFRRLKTVKVGKDAGFPKFKAKDRTTPSFRYRHWKAKPDAVYVTNIGWIRLKERDYIPTCDIQGVYATVSCRAGRWYISCTGRVEAEFPEPTDLAIGVDPGVVRLATLSDGTTYENPEYLEQHLRKLARLNRELSRRKLGSSNRQKTRAKLANLHAHIGNARNHTAHVATHDIVYNRRPGLIALENPHIDGMVEDKLLSRRLADASMGEMLRQLQYKGGWLGAEIVEIDPYYPSSRICSVCGHQNRLPASGNQIFKCEVCDFQAGGDLNAAINLRDVALKERETLNACGGGSADLPEKQEPAGPWAVLRGECPTGWRCPCICGVLADDLL